MSTSWSGQICNGEGKYYIQFETDNKELYRLVEKTCQNAMDIAYPRDIPEYCHNCSNHPSNGGSGICNCILGQFSMSSNTTPTNPLEGYYAAPFTVAEEGKIVYSEDTKV